MTTETCQHATMLVRGYTRLHSRYYTVNNGWDYVIPLTIINIILLFYPMTDCWSQPTVQNGLVLSKNKKIVYKMEPGDWNDDYSIAIGQQMTKHIQACYRWCIKILATTGIRCCSFGIFERTKTKPRLPSFDTEVGEHDEYMFWTPRSDDYNLTTMGTIVSAGYCVCELLMDDVITVQLDCTGKSGILSFELNGVDLGAAFIEVNLSKQWSVAVELMKEGEKYELQSYEQKSSADNVITFG